MSASREAFDLFHPACRSNFRRALKWDWKKLRWWKLVFSDTWNRVCSKPIVILECPKCNLTIGAPMDPNDPPGTHKVKMLCPECAGGDFSLIDYFDKDGKQLGLPSQTGDKQ